MAETINAPVAFDPDKFKKTTRAQWEAAAEAWDRWGPLLSRWLGPATEAMLDMAAVTRGSRVLDVAAGAGEQALAAARRAGAEGHVLATDISPAILGYAAQAARRAQLPPPLPGQPGPFSLGGEGVLAKALELAGFRDVEVRRVDSPVRVASAAECVRFERESFGALHQMMAALSEEERAATWKEIEATLGKFEGPEGFVGPCEMLVGAGTR